MQSGASREHLAAVKPDGLFLMLELMHFAHEVLEPESLKAVTDKEVSSKELEMAKSLIAALTTEWEPTKYQDQYQSAVMEMIEQKVQHRTPEAAPVRSRQSNVVDIVALLQESLQNAGKKEKPSPRKRGKSTAALVKGKRRAAA